MQTESLLGNIKLNFDRFLSFDRGLAVFNIFIHYMYNIPYIYIYKDRNKFVKKKNV